MNLDPLRPPGVMVAREQSSPHRDIIFHPQSRTFFWDTPPSLHADSLWPMPVGSLQLTLRFNKLTPEEITVNIDDDTMARCLALAMNPAR